jgi:hypothetical protein
MAQLKTAVCLSSIPREINAILRQLRTFRSKVGAREKRRIDLEIRDLTSVEKKLKKYTGVPHGRAFIPVKKY